MKTSDTFTAWVVPLTIISAPAYAVDYLSVAEARAVLFPQADGFVEQDVTLTDVQLKQIKKRAGVRQRNATQAAWRAGRDGQLLGWMMVDDVVGKHEFITYALALDAAGSVLGIEILSYRETYGYEVREAGWRANFIGKTVDDSLKLGADVPNISGATLSCRNVLDGVKRLLVLHDLVLRDG